jgi:phytoene/squalene synthetase
MKNTKSPVTLASSITKAASKQTYYTIRYLVDPERVADAYRAYAYFRWVDDTIDNDSALSEESRREFEAQQRSAFLARQKLLLEAGYRGEPFQDATAEEQMLIDLVRRDHETKSGLQSYLHNMMQVMEFDAGRRGRFISQAELNEYTRWLATAVTEAMHYFIGHCCYSPHDDTRYLAVTGAHITHMLRDTFDDGQAGYFNIPREVLEANHIQPGDLHSKAYRDWVRGRVNLARSYFERGREYLARVENPRCRLAGFAYTARFEWLLETIEREDYFLRPEYRQRKSFATGFRIGLSTLSAWSNLGRREGLTRRVVSGS